MNDPFDVDRPSIDQLIQWLTSCRSKYPEVTLRRLLKNRKITESQLIDLACVDLMQRRRQGQAATVEDYTGQFPRLEKESLLLDLIDAEICVRRELNQTIDESEYAKRFPKCASSISQLLRLPEASEPPREAAENRRSDRQRSERQEPSGGDFSWDSPEEKLNDQMPTDADALPERLGGYRVLRKLGHGAMGTVYEARQISLDRLVALKTIRNRIAQHPAMLARFAREAYSVAQLSHHNVVQIYDFGEDRGHHFFSMERVPGGTIADIVREKGTLDPQLAASYALQAARGLQFAHRHGMVHRDIKPANLLLTEEGVLKVADLGLVKLPGQMREVGQASSPHETAELAVELENGTDVTIQGTAVGTPAYMAPEQSIDAAAVDHRADLYSLGCTLFYMLSGLPPFQGNVAADVIDQHATAHPPDLFELNPRVPPQLQRIVIRAMAKRPRDRYSHAADMIHDLESFLGVAGEGGFSPSAEQANQWESIAQSFNDSAPQRRWTRFGFLALVGICLPLLFATLWYAPRWWPFPLSLFVAAIGGALLLDRREHGHPIVVATRRWLFSLSWLDWLIGITVAALGFVMIVFLGGIVGMTVGAALGVGAAAAFHFALVQPARQCEREPLAQAERFIRDLRLHGADEHGVQRMVARYSGRSWQRLFESLFGYRALVVMRDRLRLDATLPAAATATQLLDVICAKLDARTERNLLRRDQQRLFKIERNALKSEGVSTREANEQAWQIAAGVIQDARSANPNTTEVQAAVRAKRERMKTMLADARSGRHRKPRDPLANLKFAFSGQTRLTVGLLLVVAFVAWASHSGAFEPIQNLQTLDDLATGRVDLDAVSSAIRESAANAETVDGVPPPRLLGANPWSVGVAGLLLMMSAFVSGWRMTPPALVATLVILYGPAFGIPAIPPLEAWMIAAVAGVIVYVPGVIWGESPDRVD